PALLGATAPSAAPADASALGTARSGRQRPDDAQASVTAVSIVPGSGRAEVVISVSAAVDVQNFTLPSPTRVVIDLTGARLAMSPATYDRLARGGVTNVRLSQFRANVVRVVLDLDGPRQYTVARGEHEVRISLPGNATFAAWHSNGGASVAAGEVQRDTTAKKRETASDSTVTIVVAPPASVA